MNRVTTQFELNQTELQWLVTFAAARDLTVHAAARHAIRVLNLLEETPGAWEVVNALRTKALGGELSATPQEILVQEEAQERAFRMSVLGLLEKLGTLPELSEEVRAARRGLASVLFPKGGPEYDQLVQDEHPLPEEGATRPNASEMYEHFFGPNSTPMGPFERMEGREVALRDLDTELDA